MNICATSAEKRFYLLDDDLLDSDFASITHAITLPFTQEQRRSFPGSFRWDADVQDGTATTSWIMMASYHTTKTVNRNKKRAENK